jgi:3-dehydroquinate dehydratase
MACTTYVLDRADLNLPGKRQAEIYERDKLAGVEAECRRVGNMSNILKREGFRHLSNVSRVPTGVIRVFKTHGYPLAFQHLAQRFKASMS